MLIAIVLDRPLAEAKALVEAPDAFIQDKQNHPVIAQMGPTYHPRRVQQFLRRLQPPSRRSTLPSAAAYALPVSASGQREVPTVATHREPVPVLH